jgi:serine/threonine protein kinase
MWKYMIHPNVLPLLGITTDPLQLVSDWMSGGDLPRYIKHYPDADRLRLVRVCDITCVPRSLWSKIYEIAKGLSYLHSCNVVHGDLKGVRASSKSLS